MKKYLGILIELFLVFALIVGIAYKKEKIKKVNLDIKTILIDPGHGGRDNGASSGNVLEDEINLSIGTKLYEICINNNYISYITRTDDYDLSKEESKNHKSEDLRKRAEYINTLNLDLFVSIHVNTYKESTVNGPMVYYRENDPESYVLAVSILDKLNKLTNNDKKVMSDDYYLFKYTNIPGVIVECGFITNERERKLLIDNSYQNLISSAIFEGIKEKGILNKKK